MRNNIQNDVKAEKSIEFASKLDLSGSISSTLSMGRVNAKFCKRLLPYTKAICGEEQLMYLAPLVRPTYGKLFYKTWHYFIACRELWAGWDSMMTGQPTSANGQIFRFTKEPHAENRGLASFAFNGAKASIYVSEVTEQAPLNLGINRTFYTRPPANLSFKALVTALMSPYWSVDSQGVPRLAIGPLLGGPVFWDNSNDLDVISGNLTIETFMDLSAYSTGEAEAASGFDWSNVPIDKADYKIFFAGTYENKTYVCCLAFRFSSWGRWYASLLRALGYGFLGTDKYKHKSLLPLVGVFYAYWNTFGINQWQNIESTNAGRIKSYWDVHDDFDPWKSPTMWSTFKSFILEELGAMWVTENADYIAAHLPQPVIGSTPSGWNGIVDVNGSTLPITLSDNNSRRTNEPNAAMADGHAKLNNVSHGALDSKLIMRLYKVTNRNTPLGRKIQALAKAAGLGFFMMYCKTDYIGETSIPLDVSKVTSQSDTFNPVTEDGAPLGDYAGRGIGYKPNDKKLYHYTENEGFWFCLDAVTCDSGYSQGVDTTLEHLTKADKFQADFDGFGLVVHDKDILVGSDEVADEQLVQFMNINGGVPLSDKGAVVYPFSDKAFGFAPIYSEYKVGRSILNGGFASPTERATYLPFVLDKVILANQIAIVQKSETAEVKSYSIGLSLPVEEIPQAGTAWRYLSRFFWLSNLNRIFAYQGKDLPQLWSYFSKYAAYFEYLYRFKDNYVLVDELWFKAWSRCLPIEESWGTLDPDKRELEYFERT